MLILKCDYPFLYEFPILFSAVKLKLGYRYSQFIHRFETWIFKCWSWAVYTSKFLQIHERNEISGFLSIQGCNSNFFAVY